MTSFRGTQVFLFGFLIFSILQTQLISGQPPLDLNFPISSNQFHQPPKQQQILADADFNPKENPVRRSLQPSEIGSLCSIFQTFLVAMKVECQASSSRSGVIPSVARRFDHTSTEDRNAGMSNHGTDRDTQEQLLKETVTSDRDQMMSSSRMDTDMLHNSNSEERGGVISSRQDYLHDRRQHEFDETKILKDKTTIIVPDRGCPPGQRRDPYRGYCRHPLRIRPSSNFGHQYYNPKQSSKYYRRYLAVPTLHFILPPL